MKLMSKQDFVSVGVCESCTSKFSVEGSTLCWDCHYEKAVRAIPHSGVSNIAASPAWKYPKRA